ncbi:hypothetical protein D9619_011579 [Psilocybe cf. subviscida]|uniref:Wax synthase domain-containing protein n=1 Tax=Psilocybe cf. subviscida TaxID=2480587 RepID=A0A8H5BST5_9AGAR|nr:hypothetical protein D9619_011579 [Psilocybe cf. subviscida]
MHIDRTANNVHPATLVALEGIVILSYAVKPTLARRWGFFLLITAISTYILLFYRMNLEEITVTEVGWSARFIQLILFASSNLLLSNAQEDLRLVGQKEAITNKPFLQRLWWGVVVWGNPRGVNFTHERGNPPKPQHKTRTSFILWQLRSTLFLALIYDVNGMVQRASPYHAKTIPDVQGLQRLWRLTGFCHGVAVWSMLKMEVKILSIIFVGLGISSPADWPDFGGWILEGWTLRRMWGRVWHQMLRRPCVMHADFLAQKLNLTPKTWSTSVFKLFIGFLITGFLHYISDVYCSSSFTMPLGTFVFFLAQPVGIIIEETVMSLVADTALAQRISPRTGKVIGGLWVAMWVNLTIPYWVDFLKQHTQWLDLMPEFSIILGLWRGEWAPVNKPVMS